MKLLITMYIKEVSSLFYNKRKTIRKWNQFFLKQILNTILSNVHGAIFLEKY